MAPVTFAPAGAMTPSAEFLFLWLICQCLIASFARSDVHLIGNQKVVGSIPAGYGNVPSWRLIMKYFLWSLSPFR